MRFAHHSVGFFKLRRIRFAAKPPNGGHALHSEGFSFLELRRIRFAAKPPTGGLLYVEKVITITGKIIKLLSLINKLQKYFYYNSSE